MINIRFVDFQAFASELSRLGSRTVYLEQTILKLPQVQPKDSVEVTFTGFEQSKVDEAAQKLNKELQQSLISMDWQSYPQRTAIQRLTQAEVGAE